MTLAAALGPFKVREGNRQTRIVEALAGPAGDAPGERLDHRVLRVTRVRARRIVHVDAREDRERFEEPPAAVGSALAEAGVVVLADPCAQ